MNNLIKWLDGRTPAQELIEFLKGKKVPDHKHSFWYFFGGLTLLFFMVQLVTGILLSLYYNPTPGSAYDSVVNITDNVNFGWIVRGVHRWSAHLVVLCSIIHMGSKYFFVAYRKPREITWVSGVILLFIVLGFAFTGYLLPWTTEGYFATQIGIEIPGSMPVLGGFITRFLRGSDFVDGLTLTRVFSLHAIILPLISLVIIAFHLIQNQYTGSALPKGTRSTRDIPFAPDFVYRDALAWIGGIVVLLSLTMFFPIETGQKADMLASPPAGIRPEWYFIPLYQTIKWLPGTIMGINTEILVNMGAGFVTLVLLLLPWIHKSRGDLFSGSDRVFRTIGVIGLLYFSTTVIYSWLIP